MKSRKDSVDLETCLTMEEQEAHKDKRWAEQDRGVRKKYAGKVVAVRDHTVIESADNITALSDKTARIRENNPQFPSFVVVQVR